MIYKWRDFISLSSEYYRDCSHSALFLQSYSSYHQYYVDDGTFIAPGRMYSQSACRRLWRSRAGMSHQKVIAALVR